MVIKNMTSESVSEFVDLVGYESDYEIQNEYPHAIRCKRDGRIISESLTVYGYVQVHLNRNTKLKHILIARQFIPNPDNLPEVDHISKIRSDNRIENLRWCTQSTNAENRSGNKGLTYTFVVELPKNAVEITHYGKYEFRNYYYDDDAFYMKTINDDEYRVLPILTINGSNCVKCKDINGKYIRIMVKKFKKLYAVE